MVDLSLRIWHAGTTSLSRTVEKYKYLLIISIANGVKIMEKMNSKQRVLAAFDRRPTDRPPVVSPTSVATVESMRTVGAAFPEAHLDAQKMAVLASTGHDLLGFDNVAPYFGVQQEAAAFGADMNWGLIDSMPSVTRHPYADPDDFDMPTDFLERLPVKTVLDSIRILKKKYGDKVAICGKVMGPWTLSYNLYGVEDFLIDLIANSDKAKGFLQAFKAISITFALAQIEAGADMLTWADHATGDMVSAENYEEFLFPVHQQCMRELREKAPSKIPVILHTCGKTLDRMPLFARAGFDAFHFDSKNDPEQALKAVDGKILLAGCINNAEVLLQGTQDDVGKQVTDVMRAGIQIISPECAVPCRVENQNLKTILDTVIKLTNKY